MTPFQRSSTVRLTGRASEVRLRIECAIRAAVAAEREANQHVVDAIEDVLRLIADNQDHLPRAARQKLIDRIEHLRAQWRNLPAVRAIREAPPPQEGT